MSEKQLKEFLKSMERARKLHASSPQESSRVSTIVERMIDSVRRSEELKQLNSSISAFYDELPEPALAEDEAWGQLGAAGLAAFVESEGDETVREVTPKLGAR